MAYPRQACTVIYQIEILEFGPAGFKTVGFRSNAPIGPNFTYDGITLGMDLYIDFVLPHPIMP